MARHSKNLVTGRELRAARVLAGLTQRTLGAVLGVDERAVRSGSASTTGGQPARPMMPALSKRCWSTGSFCSPSRHPGRGGRNNFRCCPWGKPEFTVLVRAHARDRFPASGGGAAWRPEKSGPMVLLIIDHRRTRASGRRVL